MNISNFSQHYKQIKSKYPDIKILIVTKYFSPEETETILAMARKDKLSNIYFAENKIQHAKQKTWTLKQVKSYLIGHLQSNKAKDAIELFDVIESVDSVNLATKLNSIAENKNIKQEIYLQINISWEEQKYWFDPKTFNENLDQISSLKNLKITWLMTMASIWNEKETKIQFEQMKLIFDKSKSLYPGIINLSMWMSWDYEIAIQAWATEVRLGSILF